MTGGSTIVELLRVRQWLKNVFVLAPLFFGSELFEPSAALRAFAVFAIFCLSSSATYIFNDWRDLEADRQHPKKRLRSLASGKISVPVALALMGALLAGAAVLAIVSQMPAKVLAIVALYLLVNLGYSLGLKQIPLIELFMVASGFVLRVLAGGFALEIELSPWIVVATGMVALLITVGKRRGEIIQGIDTLRTRESLFGYNLVYLDAVLAALTGGTLVVYLLFCVSDYAIARFSSKVLFTAVPVAIGIMRYVQLIMVHDKGDTPTDLVLGDFGMILAVFVFLLMFGALIYL